MTISPATANVIRGNTQTIDCNPQGNPAATQITWYFTPSGSNSQQLLNIVNSGGKYNGGTPGNPDLTITDFQTNNAGSYRCAATNAAGTGTSSNSVLTYVGMYLHMLHAVPKINVHVTCTYFNNAYFQA